MEIQLDSAAAPSNRPVVDLTQEEDNKYKALLQKFQNHLQNEQKDFNSSDHQIYYIVSTDFLNTWRDFCHSHEHRRHVPITMNSSLFDPKTKKLKLELSEKEDFEFLSEESYALLKPWHANELRRTAVKIGNEKRVPLYLNDYNYLIITNSDLKSIDQKSKRREHFELKLIQESENAVVSDLIKKILEKNEYSSAYTARLWRVDKKDNLDSLFKYLKAAADRATYEYRIKGFGKKLDLDTKIEDLQMEEGDFFVVEVKDTYQKWFLQAQNQKKCQGCYDIAVLKYPCQCEKVAYCTQECKKKDQRFHLRSCEYAQMEELNKPILMNMTANSSRGVVGLRNLGNTCFMNSCLQCCSNTDIFSQYFLKNLYEKEINKINPLGTKGKLAKNYAKFIRSAWCDSDSVVTPDAVKSAVSSINPMFSGHAQHDSQQFFSFLIDGLHEDLNRIEKKPYVESVESNNRPDGVVALESWIAHIKRNQSIITDLMTGQYKSKVTCPECSKESITFDPFITVTLPIPQNITNIFEGFFIYPNLQQKTKRLSFTYKKPSLQDWKASVGNIVKIPPQTFNIYLVSMNEGIYKAGREALGEIIYKMENENKNVFFVQMTPEEMEMKDRVEITARYSKKGFNNQLDNIWFKFPFYFSKKNTTGLTIYKRMLKFLFHQSYKHNKNKKLMGGKTYEQYESHMLQNRPFELYLRHSKRLERFYSRLQFKFDDEIKIKDTDKLQDFLQKIDENDCELDARFTQSPSDNFSMENMKEFDDITKRIKVNNKDSNEETVELSDCFKNMSEPERLDAGNQWYCPDCKKHMLAQKEMSIFRAPKILILHLKRFKQKGTFRKEKNQTKVIFPPLLDLKDYVKNHLPISEYAQNPAIQPHIIPPKYEGDFKISNCQEPLYELYAVSNHYGGLGGGHYTAYAKNAGKWYQFDDSSVRSCSESSVVSSGAYMLFYRRKD